MRKLILTLSVCSVVGLAMGQNLSSTYFHNTPTLLNPGYTGIENFLDLKLGGQRLGIPVDNPPSTVYLFLNNAAKGRNKTRGPKNLKFKSQYDIDKLASEVKTPNNGLRLSNLDLYRKHIRDSVKGAIRKLDKKTKEILRKKLQQQSFEAAYKHGYGTYVHIQKAGAFYSNIAGLNYAIHLPLSKQWVISFGAGIRLNSSGVEVESLEFGTTNDPVLVKYENGKVNHNSLSLTNGLVLYSRFFNVAYGVQNSLKLINPKETAELFEAYTDIKHSFNLFGKVPIDEDWEWQNGISFSNRITKDIETQFVSRVIYNKRLSLGGTYNFKDRYSINTFAIVSDYLRINYIIDLPAKTSIGQNTIHEISLNFMISRGGSPSPYFY